MTVLFTHKSADAWDALGMALMEAGFTIEASWPVNTECEQSLHQAKKNAAASTIMLVCRMRDTEDSGGFFGDVEPLVRAEARRALADFSTQGIAGRPAARDIRSNPLGPRLRGPCTRPRRTR